MDDVCTQTLDSLSNPGIEQNFSENIDDEDINQLKGNSNIFQLLNDHNKKFKDDDFYEFDYGDTDSIDMNDDVEETSEAQYNVFNDDFETQQPPNATELSVMLVFVWKRYAMSKAAANDICRILNAFNVPNMPKDFRGVMSHVKNSNPTLLHGNQSFICPSCFGKNANASKCNTNG
ncbi:unnamed protein product, partial [Rotaria sp. Silwood2]